MGNRIGLKGSYIEFKHYIDIDKCFSPKETIMEILLKQNLTRRKESYKMSYQKVHITTIHYYLSYIQDEVYCQCESRSPHARVFCDQHLLIKE